MNHLERMPQLLNAFSKSQYFSSGHTICCTNEGFSNGRQACVWFDCTHFKQSMYNAFVCNLNSCTVYYWMEFHSGTSLCYSSFQLLWSRYNSHTETVFIRSHIWWIQRFWKTKLIHVKIYKVHVIDVYLNLQQCFIKNLMTRFKWHKCLGTPE